MKLFRWSLMAVGIGVPSIIGVPALIYVCQSVTPLPQVFLMCPLFTALISVCLSRSMRVHEVYPIYWRRALYASTLFTALYLVIGIAFISVTNYAWLLFVLASIGGVAATALIWWAYIQEMLGE